MAVIPQANPLSPPTSIPAFPANAVAITPADADTYDFGVTVYVGVGGNVAIVPFANKSGAAITFKGLPAGSVLPCLAYKVMATNTTATDLVGLY